jgi:hypothetical protein
MQICQLAARLFHADGWTVGSNSFFPRFFFAQSPKKPTDVLMGFVTIFSINSDIFAKQHPRLTGLQYSGNVFCVR